MMRRNSVSRRLIRGLGQVGLVGTLLLLAAVVFFYRLTFSHLEAGAALQRAILESLEHVALPVVVLMVPVTILGLRVIRQAFVPLEDAAASIEAVKGMSEGFASIPRKCLKRPAFHRGGQRSSGTSRRGGKAAGSFRSRCRA
jgi:NADH:ubiquinone oxidoreductase subunit 5 (subunit L)/multisubunit Na+/H+ antiporter MnhA subunit